MASPGELRFPSIDGLRAFEATARLGSYERAAGELHITSSAVGKRVAAVEALLAMPLFTRQGGALALTAGGLEYLGQVRSALGLLAAMPQHRRAAQRLQRVRVCAPPTFARQVLVPALPGFTQAHPEVELEVVLSVPFLDLDPGRADVEVRSVDTLSPGRRPLLDDQVLPLAAPELLARSGPWRQPADLAHAPLLRTPIEPWTPWFRAAGLDWPEPDRGHRFVDLGLTLEAAAGAQGIVLARPSLARPWLADGRLLPLFGPAISPAQHYQLSAPSDGGAAACFADWLAGTCSRIASEARARVDAALQASPRSGPTRRTFRTAPPRAR